jgi:hypothetical protein
VGTRRHRCFGQYATSQKVKGSIPHEIEGFPNCPGIDVVLAIFLRAKGAQPAGKADNFVTNGDPTVFNM